MNVGKLLSLRQLLEYITTERTAENVECPKGNHDTDTLKKLMTHRLAIFFFPLAISFCARYISCVNFPVQVDLFMEYDTIDLKLSLKYYVSAVCVIHAGRNFHGKLGSCVLSIAPKFKEART